MSAPKRRHKWEPDPLLKGRAHCIRCGMVMEMYEGVTGPRCEFRTAEWRFVANSKATAPQPPCQSRSENP